MRVQLRTAGAAPMSSVNGVPWSPGLCGCEFLIPCGFLGLALKKVKFYLPHTDAESERLSLSCYSDVWYSFWSRIRVKLNLLMSERFNLSTFLKAPKRKPHSSICPWQLYGVWQFDLWLVLLNVVQKKDLFLFIFRSSKARTAAPSPNSIFQLRGIDNRILESLPEIEFFAVVLCFVVFFLPLCVRCILGNQGKFLWWLFPVVVWELTWIISNASLLISSPWTLIKICQKQLCVLLNLVAFWIAFCMYFRMLNFEVSMLGFLRTLRN